MLSTHWVAASMFSMPVGRVKARSPLGHSGQRKLHDVVGSMDKDVGMAPWGMTGRPVRWA